jgi:protein phosphatase
MRHFLLALGIGGLLLWQGDRAPAMTRIVIELRIATPATIAIAWAPPPLLDEPVPLMPFPAAAKGGMMRPLEIFSHGLTDKGRVRPANEDQFLIAELRRMLTIHQTSLSQPAALLGLHRGHLFVVADGIGGHRAGEQASALAILTVEQFMLNTLKWFFQLRGEAVLAEFQEALRNADARIFEAANRHPELKGMGTTLTMGYAVDGALYVCHVGDSRCYLFRRGELRRLTRDHTLVEQMVQKGMDPSEARASPFRNVITNAVGGNDPGVQVDVHKHALEPGDVVLLCSDGLHGMVDEAAIARTLAKSPDAAAACSQLVEQANAAGGRDNVTVVVARFVEPVD